MKREEAGRVKEEEEERERNNMERRMKTRKSESGEDKRDERKEWVTKGREVGGKEEEKGREGDGKGEEHLTVIGQMIYRLWWNDKGVYGEGEGGNQVSCI